MHCTLLQRLQHGNAIVAFLMLMLYVVAWTTCEAHQSTWTTCFIVGFFVSWLWPLVILVFYQRYLREQSQRLLPRDAPRDVYVLVFTSCWFYLLAILLLFIILLPQTLWSLWICLLLLHAVPLIPSFKLCLEYHQPPDDASDTFVL